MEGQADGSGWGGLLALAIVVGGAAAASWWWERRRTHALRDVALRLGLSFDEGGDSLHGEPFTALPLFQRGFGQRFRNVIRGSDLQVFGFRYYTRSGRRRRTHHQTVAVLRRPEWSLPDFAAAPEGLFDKIGSWLGAGDIDFQEDPGFSSAYRLRGPDEAAVRSLFHAGLRHELTLDPVWCLQGRGEWLVMYRRARRISPHELASFIQRVRRVSEVMRSR